MRGWGGVRKAIAHSTSCRAEERLQRLYADLAGPMPTSDGSAQYCLMIVDNDTNMAWLVFRPNKSTATVTHASPMFLAAINTSGKPACF